jgi:hypothetical protein
MRKEWILTDEEKTLKRQKIVRNRMIKQQAQSIHHQTKDFIHSNTQIIEVSFREKKESFVTK